MTERPAHPLGAAAPAGAAQRRTDYTPLLVWGARS
jgi:hypothetical protein